MAFHVRSYSQALRADTLAIGLTEDKKLTALPLEIKAEVQQVLRYGDFTGKEKEIHVMYPPSRRPKRLILCGLGPARAVDSRKVREAVGRAVKRAQNLRLTELVFAVDSFALNKLSSAEAAHTVVLASTLAAYRYREYKPSRPDDRNPLPLRLALACRQPAACAAGVPSSEKIAASVNFARVLADRPGNVMFPQVLAAEARALAKKYPAIKVRVLQKAELVKGKFGALLAVGSGSVHPPVLIELRYTGAGRKAAAPIALVGKGITFDSGGISIKPANKMDEMRYDMSGAAAVLGILRACAETRLPVNLVGVIPSAENLPSGSAYRPGDILTSLSGKTIEVLNTDAEGRLILADGLTYAQRFQPQCIVDFATLTGAVLVALGTAASGLMTNHQKLADEIIAAGEASGERVWQLPLWDDFRDLVKSDVADIANIAKKPMAGTVTGAAFLEAFVGNTPWVHLDIAGTAWADAPGPVYAKGATGVGIQLVMAWLQHRKTTRR